MKVRIIGLKSAVKGERFGAIVEVDDTQAESLIRGGVVEPIGSAPVAEVAPVAKAPDAPAKRGRKPKA